MSLKKSATRRLSLLAGSSLVAASLSAVAMTGVTLTPGAAYAYDECAPANPPTTLTDGAGGVSDPSLNGATADSFACAGTPYATGITYSSSGALTVTKTGAGAMTVTANGVNLSGTGADAVTWDSSAGGVTGGAGTAGPVIDISSVSGPISITTAAVTGNQAGTTNAIRAVSTGGGSITVSSGSLGNTAAGAQAAIAATTNGGAINISTTSSSGRLRGILAQTSGAGAVTLSVGSLNASAVDGIAGVDATAGTGGLALSVTTMLNGGAGKAIIASSTGGAIINNTGQIGEASFGVPTIGGSVDFSGVTAGGVTFNNTGSGRWLTSGTSVFSAGNDTINMSGTGQNKTNAGTVINMGAGNDRWNLSTLLGVIDTTIDFGAGTDTFNMAGQLSASGALTLTGLEAFNNSGVILLGAYVPVGWQNDAPLLNLTDYTITDGFANDTFVMHSGTFTGSGASRIVLDAYLDGREQVGCETLSGAADCMDLRGASTAGVTLVTPNNLSPDAAQGGYTPQGVTIVDVSGAGSSGAGHFVLDPGAEGYRVDPIFGGVIGRPGLFSYALRYDEANQRHALVGVPRSQTMEYSMLASATTSIWHMSTEAVTDRQADLRDGAEGGSVWLRTGGEYTKRNLSTELEVFGDTFAFDNSYKLYAGQVMGGMDFVNGSAAGYDYVLGGQIGYVSSSFDLTASSSSGRMTGASGGVYASLWSPRFFLDGTFNTNVLTLDYDSPGLSSKTNTYLNSVGGRAEGGARLRITDRTFAEPLAAVAYVRTSFEEISLAGGEIAPADATSLRGSVGLRLGADMPGQVVNASYFVTGRAWEEFEGDSTGLVHNPGADLPFGDDFSGGFGEAELGINLFNTANTFSGFLTTGVKFKDGYSAVDLSGGVRLAW